MTKTLIVCEAQVEKREEKRTREGAPDDRKECLSTCSARGLHGPRLFPPAWSPSGKAGRTWLLSQLTSRRGGTDGFLLMLSTQGKKGRLQATHPRNVKL